MKFLRLLTISTRAICSTHAELIYQNSGTDHELWYAPYAEDMCMCIYYRYQYRQYEEHLYRGSTRTYTRLLSNLAAIFEPFAEEKTRGMITYEIAICVRNHFPSIELNECSPLSWNQLHRSRHCKMLCFSHIHTYAFNECVQI